MEGSLDRKIDGSLDKWMDESLDGRMEGWVECRSRRKPEMEVNCQTPEYKSCGHINLIYYTYSWI